MSAQHVCRENLQSLLEVLRADAPECPTTYTKQDLKSLVETVKSDAAKAGMLFGSESDRPSDSEIVSLLSTLQQHVTSLVVLCHSITYASGPTLQASVRKYATSLITSAMEFCSGLGEPANDVRRLTGRMWDVCDTIAKMPWDNKSAIFRRIADDLRVLIDTSREMSDLQQHNTGDARGHVVASIDEEPEQEDGGGAAVVDLDDDCDEMMGLSEEELVVLGSSCGLVSLAIEITKACSKLLLKAPDAASADEAVVSHWEDVAASILVGCRHVEKLGASMYSPQDDDEVLEAGEGVFSAMEEMLGKVMQLADPSSEQELQELCKMLHAQHSTWSDAVDGLCN